GGTRIGDALLREERDREVLEHHAVRREDIDAANAEGRTRTIDADVAQDDVDSGGVDVNAVGSGGQDRAHDSAAAAVDGDRLGDGDGAEPARIETVDFAAGRSLGDGAGKRLAGRGTAARIDVVADARDPGSGGLSMGRSRCKHGSQKSKKYGECSNTT